MKRFLIVMSLLGASNHFFGFPFDMVRSAQEAGFNPRSEGGRLALDEHPSVTKRSGFKAIDGTDPVHFRVSHLSEPNVYTIVVFSNRKCPACRRLNGMLKRFLALRPDVAVRQVNMPPDWSRAWAKATYGVDIAATPHVHLYDPERKLVGQDAGLTNRGAKLVYEWVNAEFELENRRRMERS